MAVSAACNDAARAVSAESLLSGRVPPDGVNGGNSSYHLDDEVRTCETCYETHRVRSDITCKFCLFPRWVSGILGL